MADVKVTAMTELTVPTNDDLLMIVDSPGGTPVSKKVTAENLVKNMSPKTHASSHQSGGGDVISVAGLTGVLATKQDADKIQGHTVDETAIADDRIIVYKTSGDKFIYEAKGTPSAHASSHQPGGGDILTSFILHSLATAANDFLVASGSGAFVKKTLAEAKAILGNIISRGGTILSPSGAINVIGGRMPFACTLTNVRGYRVGGTGATINARKNGTDNHLSSALSLTSADTWMDGGSVLNTSYAAGDKWEIMVVSISGTPTQIAIQVDFTV